MWQSSLQELGRYLSLCLHWLAGLWGLVAASVLLTLGASGSILADATTQAQVGTFATDVTSDLMGMIWQILPKVAVVFVAMVGIMVVWRLAKLATGH